MLSEEILWRHNLGNKQLQYVHCRISQEVKEIKKLNLVIWNLYTKCGGKTIPRLILETQAWAYLWISSLKFFIHFVFIVWIVEGYQNIIKLSFTPLVSTHMMGLVSLYLHCFWKKIFLLLYFIKWLTSTVWLLYFVR